MTGLLLEKAPPEGLLGRLPWRNSKIECETLVLQPGVRELTVLRIPPRVAQKERGWRRIERALRRSHITALVCRDGLIQQNTAAAQEVLRHFQTVSPRDYAHLLTRRLFEQAAQLCNKPLQKRSCCIVDQYAERVDLDLLLMVAQKAGRVSVVTDRHDLLEPILEQLFEQTGLPVQCMSKSRIEADLVLLLSHSGISVRAILVVDLAAQKAHILEGRVFQSAILILPLELDDTLPEELIPVERSCLGYLLMDQLSFSTLRFDKPV